MEKQERDIVLNKLRERAKELRCLYEVNELLKNSNQSLDTLFAGLIDIIPSGWQHTTVCEVLIVYEGKEYYSKDWKNTSWYQKADLVIDGNYTGEIRIYYTLNIDDRENPFLPDEQRLLNTIAERVSQCIFHRKLEMTIQYLKSNTPLASVNDSSKLLVTQPDEHWKWRMIMAEKIAGEIDAGALGVREMYLIGSTKNATAGPGSDIDLLVHFSGTNDQRLLLQSWIDGWGRCLSYMNFQRTGYQTPGSLIDLHIITDEDIASGDSYASLISAVDDRARPLKMR